MTLSVRARALVVVAAAASMIALPMAAPSGAAAGATCKKASYSIAKAQFSVAQCTPTAATGGSGKGPVSGTQAGQTKGTLNVTVTWAQHKGTTKAKINFNQQKTNGRCPKVTLPATMVRDKITGSVTGGSGTALKTIKKGQAVSGSVCIKTSGTAITISLEPNTVLKW
jgi:hypothetical protein